MYGILTYIWVIFRANVGKYSSTMEHMGGENMVKPLTTMVASTISAWGPMPCLSLRVDNRPSVLGIFIYVPWGGVGWGNNVHVLASVPDQLTSCPENEQKLNDLIWTYVRTWQWRWEANVVGKALLEKTGAYLAKM